MIYIDTSVIVSLLAPEVHSAEALAWFERVQGGDLYISDFVRLEIASALSRKRRSGHLNEPQQLQAGRMFERISASLGSVEITARDYRLATGFVGHFDTGLRAADALHLAIAAAAGARLATFDIILAAAAERFGVAVEAIA